MAEARAVGVVLCGDLNMVRCFSDAALAQAGLSARRVAPVVVSTRPGESGVLFEAHGRTGRRFGPCALARRDGA